MTTLYFPITITSSRKSIKLSGSAYLMRIDDTRCRKVLGIQEVVLTETGSVSEVSHEDNAPWHTWMMYLRRNNPTHDLAVFQTNFLLSVSSRRQAILIGFAMKLLDGTRSGPFIGFSDMRTSQFTIQFLNLCPYWGGDFLSLGRAEIKILRTLVEQLERSHGDKRLDTVIEKFCYAESAGVPSTALRFLELSVVLEMLFLPKATSELSYRFQLRVAKWFSRHYHEDVRVVTDHAKRIYALRSKIAHTGTAEVTDEDMNTIRRIARMALRKFVLKSSLFDDKYLDELCLAG